MAFLILLSIVVFYGLVGVKGCVFYSKFYVFLFLCLVYD